MASDVDGFVPPVPGRSLPADRRLAREAGEVWREHGALASVECVEGDPGKGAATKPESMPFDLERTSWGGLESVIGL